MGSRRRGGRVCRLLGGTNGCVLSLVRVDDVWGSGEDIPWLSVN